MKLLLVIDVADDVAKNYKALTINYDLRGDYGEWDESIKYVEDCPLRQLPKKFNEGIEYDMDGFGFDKYLETGFKMGWDAYYDKITKNHIGDNTEKVGETE